MSATGPQSQHGVVLAALFRRLPGTTFSSREDKLLKGLEKGRCFESLDDLTLVCQYYQAERKKGDRGIHRRDLATFLENYRGELDRARAWAEKNPQKVVRQKTQGREQPKLWPAFLEEKYPEARVTDFWHAPESVRNEFREWEKKQL